MISGALGKERQLVLLLAKSHLSEAESSELIRLLNAHMDWSQVIGYLELHRLTGIAWHNLNKYVFVDEQNKCTFPRFFWHLRNSHQILSTRIVEQLRQTALICETLERHNIRYALLKGAVLSYFVYESPTVRDFNDNDILVHRDQVQKAVELIKELGYEQSEIKQTKTTVPKTRKETMFWSMVSHEVFPLSKRMEENPFLPFHIVDLQFSINLMSKQGSDDLVEELLSRRLLLNLEGQNIHSLSWEDNLLFLCIHLSREAMTILDVMKYKDFLLYKFCDIYNFLINETSAVNWDLFVERVQRMGFGKEVYYALNYTQELFGDLGLQAVLDAIRPNDLDFLVQVYQYDSDEVVERWDGDIIERVFDFNRAAKWGEGS